MVRYIKPGSRSRNHSLPGVVAMTDEVETDTQVEVLGRSPDQVVLR